jgi:signal peptidase I
VTTDGAGAPAGDVADHVSEDGEPQPDPPIAGWPVGRVVAVLAAAALAVVLVRLILVQSFVIPSASMEPTLRSGDRVLVSRLDYRFGDVRRGDVVVFDGGGVFDPPRVAPASGLARLGRQVAAAFGVPVGERDYVKRVVGLPGERVACCDASGRLTVDSRPLSERYLVPGDAPSEQRFDVVVPPGRLWVMGDSRADSGDSRAHLGDPGGGTVPLGNLVGRVVSVWWPLGRATGVGRVDALGLEGSP